MENNKKQLNRIIRHSIMMILVIASIVCLSGCINNTETNCKDTNGIIVFQSDFGLKDGAASEMKGVALSVDPSLQLYDITHEIPAFSIWDASYRLYQTYKYWPSNTVFVSVVDPGVGSERLSIVAKMKNGSYVVTPDNGTLTFIAEDIEEVRVIDETKNRLPGSENSSTFHGRDVYAYTAARLASGIIQFKDIGIVLSQQPIMLEYSEACIDESGLCGTIEMLDTQYGNVWTNIGSDLAVKYNMEFGKDYDVIITNDGEEIYNSKVKYINTFSDVELGEPLIYINSLGKMALAINNGNFADTYGISYGNKWNIVIR